MSKIFKLISILIISSNLHANVSILNGLSHVYNANPGEKITGRIVLYNSSSSAQTVRFEINDAVFSCTENRKFVREDNHQRSSRTWFEGPVMEKELKPFEKYTYRFAMTVPTTQTSSGSYWSMLMVSVDKPIRSESIGSNIGLNTKMRYAVGLIINVNRQKQVELDFLEMDLKNESQAKNLEVRIKNQGVYAEGVELSLEVYNLLGEKIAEFKTARNIIFPGVCREYTLNISSIQPGQYKGVILANSRKEFIGTNFNLNIQ